MSFRYPCKELDQDFPTVIDTFAPKPFAHDLSPPSSASSERGSTSPPYTSNQKTVLDAFNATRSRVVRVSGAFVTMVLFLMRVGRSYLICLLWHSLFYPHCFSRKTYVLIITRIPISSEPDVLYPLVPHHRKNPHARFALDPKGIGSEFGLRMGGVSNS